MTSNYTRYNNGSSHARWHVYAHAFEMNYARTHTYTTRMRWHGLRN